MNRIYSRICSLLAASGFSERELSEFFSVLHSVDPREVLDYVKEVRMHLENRSSRHEKDLRPRNVVTNFDGPTDAEEKIIRLLLVEAGLPKIVAIELISQELMKNYPNIPLPQEGKKGFSAWVRKVLQLVPESELLYIVTRLRNQYVHDRPYDWELR